MPAPHSPSNDESTGGASRGTSLRTSGPHPGRVPDARTHETAVVLERALLDAEGRPVGALREAVDFAGTGLPSALRLALAGWSETTPPG
jgi:hypothetical protein